LSNKDLLYQSANLTKHKPFGWETYPFSSVPLQPSSCAVWPCLEYVMYKKNLMVASARYFNYMNETTDLFLFSFHAVLHHWIWNIKGHEYIWINSYWAHL